MKISIKKNSSSAFGQLASPGRWVIVSLVTALVLMLAMKYADFSAMVGALSRADLLIMFLAVLVFWLNYLFRMVRFCLLLQGALPGYTLFRVISLHGVAAYFVPMRLGELSFPWLVASSHKGSKLDAIRILVLARMLDLGVLGVLLGLMFVIDTEAVIAICDKAGCPDSLKHFADNHGMATGIVIMAGSCVGMLTSWIFFADQKKKRILTLLTTIAIWILVAVFFALVAAAVGLMLSPLAIVMLLLLTAFAQILPVQGFASAGTHEFAWVLVLLAEGYSLDDALGIALATHVLVALSVASLAAVAVFRPLRSGSRFL